MTQKSSKINILDNLASGFSDLLPQRGLEQKLAQSQKENRPLRVKLGFDPTAPDLHLGHSVVLRKLAQFQEAGHQIVVIVGDFTARIGDPTGKNKLRPPLRDEDIEKNAETYLAQLGKIIDIRRAEVLRNSTWLAPLSLHEMIGLVSKVSLAGVLERDDFRTRMRSDKPLFLHEILYPLLQGYDSVACRADIELGGTDQLLNCLMGRTLQEAYAQDPQIVGCLPILRGTDGVQKMSKSLGNAIGLQDAPEAMFGKIMSIPDEILPEYLTLVSFFTFDQQKEKIAQIQAGDNPIAIKKELAENIVANYHSVQAGADAADHFYRNIQQRDESAASYTPIALSNLDFQDNETLSLLDICSKIHPHQTRSDLKRLIQGGGVALAGEKKTDPQASVKPGVGLRLRIGKRLFFELTQD